jgi:hypothetical protein
MKLHLLPSITLLPPPHETADDAQIIEDWARGLDWVKWLLGSVRARTEVLMVEGVAWDEFADGVLRETIGPALKSAWQAALAGDLAGLIAADERLSAQLPPELAQRSIQAGAVLLKSTRHARYQAVLGRLREAVGHFFQLSLTNVIAEYLHLEWDIATRDLEHREKPTGRHSIAGLTSQVMRGTQAEEALSVVARR